jgi:hypothetical protein
VSQEREGTLQPQDKRQQFLEMIKQFLLIIVSLGLANSFQLLTHRPGTEPDKIIRIFQSYSARLLEDVNSDQSIFGGNFIVCLIYVIICARFIFHHWLYLTIGYSHPDSTAKVGDHEPRQYLRYEALGVVLTGVFLGVQSYYAAVSTFYDFVALFTIIVLLDLGMSVASRWEDRKFLRQNQNQRRRDGVRHWIWNNTVFLLLFVLSLLYIGPSTKMDLTSWWLWLVILLVVINCGRSCYITSYYFASDAQSKSTVGSW